MKCPRCDKQRILIKTWKEVVQAANGSASELTYTQYACPDPECQQRQDDELDKKHEENIKRARLRNENMTGGRKNDPKVNS